MIILLQTNKDLKIVADIFAITQSVPIAGGVNENQCSDSSAVATIVVTSLTISPSDTFVEKEKGNSNLQNS